MKDQDPILLSEVIENARQEQASSFLHSVLIPTLEEGKEITKKELGDLISRFQENNPELGANFRSGDLWMVTYEFYNHTCTLAKQADRPSDNIIAIRRQAKNLTTQYHKENPL